jgi:hypothetical protein
MSAPETEGAADEEVGAGFCAAGVWIAQTIPTNITIEKRNLAMVTRRLIGFFLYGMKARTNLTIF